MRVTVLELTLGKLATMQTLSWRLTRTKASGGERTMDPHQTSGGGKQGPQTHSTNSRSHFIIILKINKYRNFLIETASKSMIQLQNNELDTISG